jgi:glucose/arabinose dehydrogenase/archaellum component FlaF (FlaF/FlaG flagellin family)
MFRVFKFNGRTAIPLHSFSKIVPAKFGIQIKNLPTSMLKRSIYPFLLFAFPLFLAAQPKIQLANWASGFDRPVDIAHCGDGRLFVVEQKGVIWALDSLGAKLDTFLYIDPRVNSTNNEQGLLGLAFHPHYAENGYFFVYYTKNGSGDTQVSRFSVKQGSPNEADPDSELPILGAAQPYANHNGGCIKFGPDGYLYIGLGDGGSGGDPLGNGQKKNTFLGKMLRIDVNNSSSDTAYVVPSDNPFVGQAAYFPEIWSLGLRNPWRYSFDRLTGDIWIGDVGQVTREEVDFEPAGKGGRNYGWRCYEGTVPHNTAGCQPQNTYVGPVFDYDNSSMGCSMTGGFIYRGSKYPDLYGIYLNADYCSGRIWGTRQTSDSTFSTTELANLGDYEFSSFGEDRDGELYIALLSSGKIQKITELCSPFQIVTNEFQNLVCPNSPSGLIDLATVNGSGNISYAWSNGESIHVNAYLVPGTYTVTVTNGNGCSRVKSYEIEELDLDFPTISSPDTIFCETDNLLLTAHNFPTGSQLSWFRNDTLLANSPTIDTVHVFAITPVLAGTYYVQVNDSLCVLNSNSITISVESGLEPTIYQVGDTIFSDPPCTSCQWLRNSQYIPGGTGTYYVATSSGTYELEITSPNGCTYQSTGITVIISETALPANIRTFNLAPNPTQGTMQLQMQLAQTERFSLSLTDSSQRQIFMQTHQTDQLLLPIDLRALPAGTYFLHVKLESGEFVRKVVKR